MTAKELEKRQRWRLDHKIDHALGVIDQFLSRTDAYVSFSGGKDSTVLLDLCRMVKPDIKAVFCNTGNEFPEIVQFVRDLKIGGANIDIIYPEYKPKRIIEDYGFPLISKDTSYKLWYIHNRPDSQTAQVGLGNKNRGYMVPLKYRYLINEPYDCSNKCCMLLKKEPFKKYTKETGRMPIIGTMASESHIRAVQYIKRGRCNVFGVHKADISVSTPLAIWMEDDIKAYIKKRKLKICDLYNKGFERTGCMFCGFGVQFADDPRLAKLYELHPKWYAHCMNYTNNGITYREALRKLLAVNGLRLPDE